MKKTNKYGKRLMYGVSALLLMCGLGLQSVKLAAAEDVHEIKLDESCVAVSEDPAEGMTCTVEGEEYGIRFGWIADDGGFSDYTAEELGGVTVGANGTLFNFDADYAIIQNGYMHIYGNDQVVSPVVDGAFLRFDAGNLALAELDNKTFGLDVYHEPEHGEEEPGSEPGQIDDQEITWEYGTGANQIHGGTIRLDSVCEPAWAYDENAEEGEFMECVEIKDDVSIDAYDIHQDENGGQARIERGIKVHFTITPDEGYEYNDISVQVSPDDVDMPGMGDETYTEFVMPQNAKIRIVVFFTSTDENAVRVDPCMENCGEEYPVITAAEAEDAPENVKIRLEAPDDDEESWVLFAKDAYGDEEALNQFVEDYIKENGEEGVDLGDLTAKVLKEFGQIVASNFDIHLVDEDGERVEYSGDGITITLAVSEEMKMIGDWLDEYYDGEYEVVMAHILADGTVEYLPVTFNEDGTFSFTTKTLSPFAVVARAVESTEEEETAGDEAVPATLDNIMTYVMLDVVALMGLVISGWAIRRELF